MPYRTILGRRRDERGAALVEAAIVFIPLCIILFGIIEYGFIFKDSLTLSSATRAGARTASAMPRQADFYTRTAEAVTTAASAAKFKNGDKLFIYRAQPDGLPESGNRDVCGTNCVEYTWGGSAFGYSGGTWPVDTQKACLGGSDSVGVSLKLSHDAISGFFKDMQLYERTTMRLEPLETDCE